MGQTLVSQRLAPCSKTVKFIIITRDEGRHGPLTYAMISDIGIIQGFFVSREMCFGSDSGILIIFHDNNENFFSQSLISIMALH